MRSEIVDKDLRKANGMYNICSKINIPENKITGKTTLYVEKEIIISIYKLPVLGFSS